MSTARELVPVSLSPTETEAVLQLYAARIPVEQIAAELQLDAVSVSRLVNSRFGNPDPDEDKKRIAATYQFIIGSTLARARERGTLSNQDAMTVLKALEGERKLRGVDSPSRTEQKVTFEGSEAELRETARRLGLPIGDDSDKTP